MHRFERGLTMADVYCKGYDTLLGDIMTILRAGQGILICSIFVFGMTYTGAIWRHTTIEEVLDAYTDFGCHIQFRVFELV